MIAKERAKAKTFQDLRPLLFAIAYRVLGSVSEAEDAIQETWLRFAAYADTPASPKAFLSAVVTRVSIDVLRSARRRREAYVGPWFPEPLLNDPYADPERSAELSDSVSMAALVLLERLSPLERAVFVLHEVFAFGFDEIGAVVGRSAAACRQLAVRGRRHMDAGQPRFSADRAEHARLADRFFAAFQAGDVDALRELLADGVKLVGDGGGKAPQLARAVTGADEVAQLLATMSQAFAQLGCTLQPHEVNGQPGSLCWDRDGRLLNVWALDITDGRVVLIRSVLNPDKLRHLGLAADAWALRREAAGARSAHRTAAAIREPFLSPSGRSDLPGQSTRPAHR